MRLRQISPWAHVSLTVASGNMWVEPSDLLRVMTYNVRYDSMPDNISVAETIASLPVSIPQEPSSYFSDTSERPWSTRRLHVANDVLAGHVDIFGGQELLKRQVDDLQELLGDTFAWIGVGRDDGCQEGEYSAIFYNINTIKLVDWDTFWLSHSPFDVSKYPDAGSNRTATTAHFVGPSGAFTVINTHLDEQSRGQRRLGASLILRRAKSEAIRTHRPVLLTGDFNSPSDDPAYRIITGSLTPERVNETFAERYSWSKSEDIDFVFRDLIGEAPPQRRSGSYATFTNFAAVNDFASYERIDYVFGGSNGGWNVRSYRVGTNLYDDGIYASDHRPVHANVVLDGEISINDEL